jgi:chromatin remodeling complex protein RSC6
MSSTNTASAAAKKGRKATTAAAPAAAPAAPVAAAPAKAAPVAAPAPAAVISHVEAPAATEENVNVVSQFNSLVEQVNSLRSALSTIHSGMKKLEKQIPRELKKAQKGRRRKAAEGGEDKPKKETVFTKPTQISDALCTFLGVSKGTQLSRSEVTTKVCAYAKSKGLMDKQVIKADAALRKLLALTEKDELKILNLQRYLKPHYIKPAPVA